MAQVRAASCPRCGCEAGVGAVSCRSCGFDFLEDRAAAAVWLARIHGRALVGGLAGFAVVCALGAAVLVFGRSSEPSPAPLAPVTALRAEDRLLRQLRAGGLGDASTVECDGPVRVARFTRCHVGYSNGDTQLILAGLDADGVIDVEIPYPAQRRPG